MSNTRVKAGMAVKNVVSKTTTYAVKASDDVVKVDSSGGAFTVSLPAAASYPGKEVTFIKIGTGTDKVTIDPNSSETINGAATIGLNALYERVTIVSDGTNWLVKEWQGNVARYSFDTTDGYGSGNTKVRKWVNNSISTDSNSILTIDNNATNGFSIVANARLRITISYTDIANAAMEFGIVKNGSQGTTIIQSVTASNVLARAATSANNLPSACAATDIAEVGDYYWCQTDASSAAAANNEAGIFVLAERIG